MLYQNTLYASIAPSRKAALSAAVARALTVYYGEQSNLIASELALLFEAARDFSQASQFFLVAARNAVKVFANQEAISLARRGLEALKAWPDTEERAQQELFLQVTLGGPLMATRGFAAAEVEQVYARARELSQQLADPRQRITVLAGSMAFYWVRGDSKHAIEVSRELSELSAVVQDPGFVLLARHVLAVGSSFQGEQAIAQENFKQAMDRLQCGTSCALCRALRSRHRRQLLHTWSKDSVAAGLPGSSCKKRARGHHSRAANVSPFESCVCFHDRS